MTSPANSATFGAPATIAFAATAADADGTVAKVDFFQGASLIATVNSPGPYTYTVNNLGAGNYSFTARATDNLNSQTTSSAAAVTVTANQPPGVTLTSPANNASFAAPATITLTAAATDTDGTIANVQLLNGAGVVTTLTSPPYTFTLNNVTPGSYAFTAKATDDRGAITTSAAANVTVTGPVAAAVYYIYTDQLNTPRAITNEAATPVWKWDNTDPFGANAPNEDPDGDTNKFVFNLRFPGQYFDKETGTHYNYYRDYDPSIGRYIQSDPIGLTAGPNTYSYVGGNPLTYFDPQGKAAQALGCLAGAWAGPIGCGAGAAVVTIVGGALLMNAVGSDSQPSPYDPAANDPKYGSCGPDCPGQRAILNRMFHVIDGYAHSPTANPSVVASYWLGFKMQVKRYEKECGPYTPPPSISDIYLK